MPVDQLQEDLPFRVQVRSVLPGWLTSLPSAIDDLRE